MWSALFSIFCLYVGSECYPHDRFDRPIRSRSDEMCVCMCERVSEWYAFGTDKYLNTPLDTRSWYLLWYIGMYSVKRRMQDRFKIALPLLIYTHLAITIYNWVLDIMHAEVICLIVNQITHTLVIIEINY